MKMLHDEKAAAERMRAGVITSGGFLGNDSRNLAEIVAADEGHFAALGLDFDAVADALEKIAKEGSRGLGEPITLAGGLLVRSEDARGKLPCPFDDGFFHKNSVTVERVGSGDRISYSDLSIHLLREHHFCQGEGSPFRLEAAVLKRVLGL